MMHHDSGRLLILTLVAFLLLSACGRDRTPEATPTPEQIANVADVEAAAAATLAFQGQVQTAVAQTVEADSAPTEADAPTDTPVPARDTPTPEPSTETLTPTPTETPARIVVVPVDGDDSGSNNLHSSFTDIRDGQTVILPRFSRYASVTPPVFKESIVFQIEVFDERIGTENGAGIERVEFEIRPSIGDEKGNGDPVYKRIEPQAGFCVFGGKKSVCNVVQLNGKYTSRWPPARDDQTLIGGGRILNGNYRAIIDIFGQDGEATQWRWDFRIDNANLDSLPDKLPGY